MLKLFYSPGACSLAPHIVLEELQLPYQSVKMDFKSHKTEEGEDYYQINPQGSVPSLMLEDGTVITQNMAILTYLADLDPKRPLMPKQGSMERVHSNEWLGYINSDLHKTFSPLFMPDRFITDEKAQEELKQNVLKMLKARMQFVERKLQPGKYACGKDFTVIDAYLLVFFRWAKYFKLPVEEWPNYSALMQRVLERPAVRHVMQVEKIS